MPATMIDDATLADMLARLGRLEDERAVGETLHAYCTLIDHGSDEAWLDLFAEDGAFDVFLPGDNALLAARGGDVHDNGVRFEGQSSLARFIAGRNRRPDREQKHNMIDPRITIDADSATAESYYIATAWDKGVMEIYSIGRYHDRLVRGVDGRWRFRERIVLGAGLGSERPGPIGVSA